MFAIADRQYTDIKFKETFYRAHNIIHIIDFLVEKLIKYIYEGIHRNMKSPISTFV